MSMNDTDTTPSVRLPRNWETQPTTTLLKWRDDAALVDDWEAVDEVDEELARRNGRL